MHAAVRVRREGRGAAQGGGRRAFATLPLGKRARACRPERPRYPTLIEQRSSQRHCPQSTLPQGSPFAARSTSVETLIEQGEIVDSRRVFWVEVQRCHENSPEELASCGPPPSFSSIVARPPGAGWLLRISRAPSRDRRATYTNSPRYSKCSLSDRQVLRRRHSCDQRDRTSQSIVTRGQSEPGGYVSRRSFDGVLELLLSQAEIPLVKPLNAKPHRFVRTIILYVAGVLSDHRIRNWRGRYRLLTARFLRVVVRRTSVQTIACQWSGPETYTFPPFWLPVSDGRSNIGLWVSRLRSCSTRHYV